MPGTIRVSVLDFKGPESSSPSSQISVKVSMGKREYQTCDKGEFSFPLTTLRDNLVITLQDAEGKEISHTGVESRLVVEKGIWDDVFSLEGGGHVHMKLQFVLSDEEHQRVLIMREAALKKKHEELCSSVHGSPKRASLGYSEVSENLLQTEMLADEASKVSLPFNKFKDSEFNVGNSPKKITDSVTPELEKANTSKEQGPATKSHGNIRKMISAFEGSLNQEVKPSAKPQPTISPTRKIGVDPFLAKSRRNNVETEKIIPSKVDADAGIATEASEDRKSAPKLRPRAENSEDPKDSRGPVAQVIKVIIMVGFATLVLLTRKRANR